MRTFFSAALVALFASHLAAQQSRESSAAIERQFANPPAAYRTMPFFVWNGEVTEEEIDKYLADYKAQGMGGFFVHPRIGLITPYLSDRWFALFRYTVEKARGLGLEVWLYDEDPFPSGNAGGHVTAEMPESYNEGQGLALKKLSAPPADASACNVLLKKSGEGFEYVTARAADAGPGEYYCFELAYYQRRGRGYVDLIRPGVTEKFLDVTMRGYEKSVGAEFGRTVPGIFSDEPNIAPPGDSVRWTPDFFSQFEKRRGYDVRPQLPALFADVGDYRRVRHDWYATLLDLFIERWSKPYFAYTEKAGLKWTGHYWEHGWPSPNDGPDNMAMYPYHQMPGIDLLFNQFDEEKGDQFGCVRNVKELASVANQLGRKRTLSETYGGSGWELRFEDMKRNGDWEYVLGINFMNQHLSFETLAGVRKYDWPQSFSYHEPWWQHYHVLADYFGRLSLALSAGEQVNHVLILEPTTTAWMYARSGKNNADPRLAAVDQAFRPLLNRLEAMQGEYDLASERILADLGKAKGKRLAVGKRAYDVFVLPPGTENLDTSTVALLAEYLKGGGEVLSFVDGPQRVDGAESSRVRDLAARYPSQWIHVASLDDAAARSRLLTDDFSDLSGKLYHHRRKLEDGELLFFVNSSLEAPARATVRVAGCSLTKLDALTGTMEPLAARQLVDRLAFDIELPPAGSLLVIAKSTGAPVAPKPNTAPKPSPVSLGPLTITRSTPNVLRIDYCDLKLAGSVQPDMPFYLAMEKVFGHYGFRGDPWAGTQFKTEFLDRDHFAPDSGFDAVFHFDVEAGTSTGALEAVVERPQLWHVLVNGVEVQAQPGKWWLDTSFGVYSIGRQVKPGANEIIVRAQPMSVHAEIQPVYLLGDFAAVPQEKSFRIAPPQELSLGAWKDHGAPFYGGMVTYRRSFDAGDRAGVWKVSLGKWLGTAAEVKVNGRSAGIIGWQPYEADISEHVRPGANEVEVAVYGSLKNVLGPHLGTPRPGIVGPWMWRYVPEHTPPGAKYDLFGYGLFEDFRVTEAR